ncbi:RNA polymerase sigma factor [Archangium lansingense]|uniref:RNA polymerase sigma factor n=1 Tax=Archangium lansingense TaxID=2995310 RepID=UPI003B7FD556
MDVQTAYATYFPIIREKCRRMLRDPDEAQDVAQETFIRLWQARLRDGEPRRVTAWVYRTSTHLAIDRLRRLQSGMVPERPEEMLEAAQAGSLERSVQARQELERFARHVPADELEVALLSRVDGLTQLEIAEVTQVSERTVRRLLTRFDERVEQLRKRELA